MKKAVLIASLVGISGGILALYFHSSGMNKAVPRSEFSEEAKKEFAKLSKYYSGIGSVQAKYSITLASIDGKLLESEEAFLARDSAGLFTRLSGFEELIAKGYAIAVSDEDETFSAYKVTSEESKGLLAHNWQSLIWADSIHLLPDSLFELQKINKDFYKIIIHAQTGAYYKTEVDYDPQSLKLINVRLFGLRDMMDESPSIEGENENNELPEEMVVQYHYESLEINKSPDQKYFDLGKYVTVSNGKLLPKAKFRDYEIISANPDEEDQ